MDKLSVPTESLRRSQSNESSAGSFVEEVDVSEIEFHEFLGQGAYGSVKKAIWRNIPVAVKTIHGETEKKAFLTELKQLSRVSHDNIIKFYGACTKGDYYLVEELADHGSLENVLHKRPRSVYKAAHAISWVLQCARGVEYLHSMKPKPLVHRDLKPPNLLLFDLGRILKICDFGTACDLTTYMTNNQGSAAWMAPEVFEGRTYNEKCDVFSWGIILWEVLTRKKPFYSYAVNNVFATLWAVHSGARPNLIQNCPRPIEVLMTRCWHKDPKIRPSMSEIVGIVTHLSQFFKGSDEPLTYLPDEDETTGSFDDYTDETYRDSATERPETSESVGELVRIPHFHTPTAPEVREDPIDSLKSAPANLWSEDEDGIPRCFSFDSAKQKSLRKPLLASNISNTHNANVTMKPKWEKGHRRTNSYDTALLSKAGHNHVSPNSTPKILNADYSANSTARAQPLKVEVSPQGISMAYQFLEPGLQPLRPHPSSEESMQIFQDHCKLAEEYLNMQEEIKLLQRRKQKIIDELGQDLKDQNETCGMQEKFDELLAEKERLEEFHRILRVDLEKVRKQNRHRNS